MVGDVAPKWRAYTDIGLIMRYECNDFPGAFVEFSQSWTRGELKRAIDDKTTVAESWAIGVSKVVALNIPTVDGEPLTDPSLLAKEYDAPVYDDIDMRLFRWLSAVMYKAAIDATRLGETLAVALWRGTETATTANPPTP